MDAKEQGSRTTGRILLPGLPPRARLFAAIALFAVATAFALIQAPWPNPLEQPDRFSPDWAIYPDERNAFARLPVISGDLHDVFVLDDGENIWTVGDGGLVLHSPDGGRSWARQQSITVAGQPSGFSPEQVQQTQDVSGISERVRKIVVEQLGLDEAKLANSARFIEDLGADDLDTVELVMANEEEFGCEIPDDAAEKILTINDMIDYISACTEGATKSAAGKSETLEAQRFYVDLRSVHFVDDERGWAVGDLGAILATSDGGATWRSQSSGTKNHLFSVDFIDARTGWAVGWGGSILATSDGGDSWRSQSSQTKNPLWSVDFLDPRTGWAVGENGTILATTDGGATWRAQSSGTGIPLWSVDFLEPRTGWVVGENGTILATSDGGATWRAQSSGNDIDFYSVDFLDPLTGWAVGLNGTILATSDGGDTWRRQSSGTGIILESVGFLDPRTGWAVGANGAVLATSDGGDTWAPRSRGLEGMLGDGSGWRTVTDSVEFTTDGGETWQPEDGSTYARYPAPWYYLSLLLVAGLIAPMARDVISRVLASEEDGEGAAEAGRKDDDPDRLPEPQPLNLTGRFVSDRPLEAGDPDPLGFGRIARTISLFLRHKKTEPPLTFAITGEWGSGKSSLMNLLRADLVGYGWRPVWFNAWHYQKEEHLLASLLDVIRRRAVPHWWRLSGLWVRAKLVFIRLWRKRTLVIPFAVLFAAGSLLYALFPEIARQWPVADLISALVGDVKTTLGPFVRTWLPNSAPFLSALVRRIEEQFIFGEFLVAIIALAMLWWLARNRLTSGAFSPAKLLAAIAGRSKSSDLGDQLQFRHRFADEFRDMALALSRPRLMSSPLVVFIDDLDRCRPQNVLDVLEAVNFLVTSGICYVVIGMDRDRVEACIGLGFKDVAKEMAEEPEADEVAPVEKDGEPEKNKDQTAKADGKDDSEREHEERRQRRAYARDYLEKLINIEVPVPELDDDKASRLLGEDAQKAGTLAKLMLKAATVTERVSVPSLLFLAFVAIGVILMPPPAPEAGDTAKVESKTSSGGGADTGGAGETRGADQTGESLNAGAGQAFFIGGQVPNSSDMESIKPIAPVILILAVLIWVGRRRIQADIVADSKTFDNELAIWRPVILARRSTPRAIKRYLNRVRYLAMRLRPDSPVGDGRGVLVHLVQDRYPALRDQAEPAIDGEKLSESMLVAMSAIEYCDREWLEKDELFKRFHDGLADDLKKDLPDGMNEDVVDALAASLQAHVANPHNVWPPSPEQRNAFSDIAAGVRFAAEDADKS